MGDGEQSIIDMAIRLDQKKDGLSRASARALRAVAVPLEQYFSAECERWNEPNELGDSMLAFTGIIGMFIGKMIKGTRAPKNEQGGLRDEAVEAIRLAINQHLKNGDGK